MGLFSSNKTAKTTSPTAAGATASSPRDRTFSNVSLGSGSMTFGENENEDNDAVVTFKPHLNKAFSTVSTTSIGDKSSSSSSSLSSFTATKNQKYDKSLSLGGEASLLGTDVEWKGVQEILDELSLEEKAQLSGPTMPIRHLRAEKGNVSKAISKLRDCLRWRQEFQVSRLVSAMNNDSNDDEFRSILRRECEGKVWVRGYTKEGRALLWLDNSRNTTSDEVNQMRHLVWNIEKAIACTRTKSKLLLGDGRTLEKYVLVIDLKHFSMKDSPPMSTSKYTLDILQKHYPEHMYKIYVLHAPFAFRIFWNMVKPFIDATTKQKITFCSSKKEFQNTLHKEVDLDILEPTAYGTASKPFAPDEYLNLPFDIGFDDNQNNKE